MMDLAYLPWNQPADRADRPCLRDDRLELTYAGFATRVDGAAEQLADHGVVPGSVVAVMLANRVELLVCLAAAWRLGAAATPLNPVFTANEADYQITDADATLVVKESMEAPDGGRRSFLVDELRPEPRGGVLPQPRGAGSDLALLIYTSGSTGRPKGVMLAHSNVAAMAGSMVEALTLGEDDHCLLVLPLFHMNAICVSYLATMIAGGQLSILGRFHPREFLATIERLRPTFFSAVPTIYAHLVSQPDDVVVDTGSIRFAICGAAPAPEGLLRETEERFGFRLVEGYGLTEGTCASTANPVNGPRKVGTVGVALPGQRVAVMDDDDNLLPAGDRGEVVIKGDNVMQGYLNKPEATAEALGDGWLHTGDIGILDDEGYLRLVGRIKDVIIRGGENIYPKEIESVLHAHAAVLDAAVVGAPHPTHGEVPVAYVVLRPEHAATEGELLAVCREQLTKIKVPVSVTIQDALPRNPIGKVDGPALRSALAADPIPEGA